MIFTGGGAGLPGQLHAGVHVEGTEDGHVVTPAAGDDDAGAPLLLHRGHAAALARALRRVRRGAAAVRALPRRHPALASLPPLHRGQGGGEVVLAILPRSQASSYFYIS